MRPLSQLRLAARTDGWVTESTVSFAQFRLIASASGWVEIPNRYGDGPVSALRPLTQEQARPRSLSVAHGMGQQPLHTDGAHLTCAPDFVAMHSSSPNATPTLLWRPPSLHGSSIRNDLGYGVFHVDGGSDSFLAHVRDGGKWRYDPGCMTPCDQRARRVSDWFHEQATTGYVIHSWSEPNTLLLIDNRRALHGRAAVADGDQESRVLERVTYVVKSDD